VSTILDEQFIIDQLEELAEKFGIQIRYEPIKQDEDLVRVVGGLCLLRGEYVLIVDSKAGMVEKIIGNRRDFQINKGGGRKTWNPWSRQKMLEE